MKRLSKKNKCSFCREIVLDRNVVLCEKCKRIILKGEKLSIGVKVVYMPSASSMIREITDDAYDSYGFYPGEILTVRGHEIKETEGGFHNILVEENIASFSPFELVPKIEVSDELRQSILDEFRRIFKKYSLKWEPFFLFKKNDKVRFLPKKYDLELFGKDYSRAGLIPGENYVVTSKKKRKWLILDNKKVFVYWKSVSRIDCK